MAIIHSQPPYPVITRTPTVSQTDYRDWSALTVGSGVAGFFIGRKDRVSKPCMIFTSLLGFVGGYVFAYQSSAGRLMGFKSNPTEVKKYHA